MPRDGVSSEWVGDKENEIAKFLVARDQVDALYRLIDLLHQRHMLTDAYYHDARDALDYIACMLLTGKKNTVLLRDLTAD